MRVCEQRMVKALDAGKPWWLGSANTAVEVEEDGAPIVSLHGHDIVGKEADGTVWLDFCAWPTPTMRSRMNAALRWMMKGTGYQVTVWQEDFEQHATILNWNRLGEREERKMDLPSRGRVIVHRPSA